MSDFAGWINSGATGAEALGKLWAKLFTPGSATILTPTAYQVTQRAAGTNMSVDIAVGTGLSDLPDYSIPVWSSTSINKTVTAADPTNPRNDIVVRYVDLTAYGTNNNSGATKFIIVSGTPAGSPSDPSDVTIQAAVGAGNPWEKLARVTVPANATSIVNANITDLRAPIAFAGNLWGGSNNTVGHTVPNVADDTVELLGASQTITGDKTFSGQVNINGMNIAGAWQSWTPTFTNWTIGTGGSAGTVAMYMQIGKTVFFRIRSTLCTSGQSVSGAIVFSLPVSVNAELASATHEGYLIGECKLLDATIAAYQGRVQVNGSAANQAFLIAQNASGTYLSQATTSATIPFSWGAGDMFMAEGFYEAA